MRVAPMTDDQDAAEKFADLPEGTRRFIANLDADDIATLGQAIEMVKTTMTFGRVARWLILGVIGLFLGVVMLWEAVLKFLGFFKA